MTDSKQGNASNPGSDDAAVNLIRQKVGNLYGEEPNAKAEVEEVEDAEEAHQALSKHQAFMQKISQSGMSLAQIQTAWHSYYIGLPDEEKHEVWQEFYAEHDKQKAKSNAETAAQEPTIKEESKPKPEVKETPSIGMSLPDTKTPAVHHVSHAHKTTKKHSGAKTISEVKHQLTHKASLSAQSKLRAKQQFQSILFGIGMGLVVVIILLFGVVNDRFIAPVITPSRNVSSTPIIIDSTSAVGTEPKIIIPKINVEIPVVYDEPSVEEHAVQNALERGVVHYATTPNPGQLGNAVIFGHSSNNILNKGKYKFAFVLLNRMEVNDTFYITKDGVRYAYKIYEKKIVDPTDLGVLNANNKKATVTLITCDPPGTTLHRLIVVGEQISPNPEKNVASTAKAADSKETILPSNAPSLWERIKDWF